MFEFQLLTPIHDATDVELPPSMQNKIDQLREHEDAVRATKWMVFKRVTDVVYKLTFLGAAIALMAQILDRAPPFNNREVLLTPVVRQGEKLRIRVDPMRYRICEWRATFTVFDGEEAPHIVKQFNWQQPYGGTGQGPSWTRDITIGRDFAPGASRLVIERDYRCPFNVVHRVWPIVDIEPDIKFEITPFDEGTSNVPERRPEQ